MIESASTETPKAAALQVLRKMLHGCQDFRQCRSCEGSPQLDTPFITAQCLRSPLHMLKNANKSYPATHYRWSLASLRMAAGPVVYDATCEEQDKFIINLIRLGLRHVRELWRAIHDRCSPLLRGHDFNLYHENGSHMSLTWRLAAARPFTEPQSDTISIFGENVVERQRTHTGFQSAGSEVTTTAGCFG